MAAIRECVATANKAIAYIVGNYTVAVKCRLARLKNYVKLVAL